MKIEKVLITGAAGYLAHFVIERLRSKYELTLTDRVAVDRSDVSGLHFIPGDITCDSDVANACEGQDAVVHLVALVRERFDKPAPMFADVMVKGTWNVAEACVKQGVQRLVNISSISAVGSPARSDRPYRAGESAHFNPGDLYYALAKSLGEQVGKAYHQAHGLSVIHLRPGVIAGDGHNPGPKMPQDTSQPWFVYVNPRDVAQAVECALACDIGYGYYHIVAGRGDSRFDWRSAAQELGYSPEYNWQDIPQANL